ncbi:MAG: methionine synthase [Anaerolineae bacterium]|nr:methionine synthase [Anaerolineae bacterium]
MHTWTPHGLATGIGSLPHTDARAAVRVTLENFSELPYWPQLPKRDFRENMYAQFSEGLVGIQMDLAHEWMGLVKDDTVMDQVEAFYARYLEENPDLFAVSEEYAAGLYALRDEQATLARARWIKGQVTGPISFGLKVVDQTLKPMLYDDTLRDVLVKHITRKAQWQEKFLSALGTPIVFIDEPSLALIGASVVALNRDEVVRDLEEIFSALHCLTGTHCCGNTDWGMLLQTSVDIISFDAYNYAENLALFADDVKRFLERGGVLAWGIVPTVEEQIANESVASLEARLDAAMQLLARKGIDRALLLERALITPACGLGTVSVAAAERALMLTRQLAERVRERV